MGKILSKKEKCPYCGAQEFVEGKQEAYGSVAPANKVLSFKSQTLYHIICLNCGTVVRSYIKNPTKILIKK